MKSISQKVKITIDNATNPLVKLDIQAVSKYLMTNSNELSAKLRNQVTRKVDEEELMLKNKHNTAFNTKKENTTENELNDTHHSINITMARQCNISSVNTERNETQTKHSNNQNYEQTDSSRHIFKGFSGSVSVPLSSSLNFVPLSPNKFSGCTPHSTLPLVQSVSMDLSNSCTKKVRNFIPIYVAYGLHYAEKCVS